MRERHVLAATMHDREALTAVADHIGREDFSEQGYVIWTGICKYYDADAGCRSVDAGILADSIGRGVSADKHKTMFSNLIAGLDGFDVSNRNVVDDLLATKREVKGNQLANALLSGEPAGQLLYEYTELLDADSFEKEEEKDARIG